VRETLPNLRHDGHVYFLRQGYSAAGISDRF
jgi:hypothetical protein